MNPAALPTKTSLSLLEKLFSLTCDIRPAEGRVVLLLFSTIYLFMLTTYLLKPIRETLILASGGAEVRSYAIAAQALLLVFIIPLYGLLFKNSSALKLMQTVIGACIGFIALFFVLFYLLDIALPIAFYVWLGLFGVLIIAQFWAFTSDILSEEAGTRLFATIALGAGLGALSGSSISAALFSVVGPRGIMLASCLTLGIAMLIVPFIQGAVPHASRVMYTEKQEQVDTHLMSGFMLVIGSRYLIAIAIFVTLFNWINSTGDFVLSAWVGAEADKLADSTARENYIAQFYSEFYLIVGISSFVIQALLVSRIIKYLGVSIALFILPTIMIIAYTGIYFLPIFSLFYLFRVAENSLGYSLQSTLRQILFLPTNRQIKYEARSVVETFFWRVGDVLQGIVVYLGFNVFNFDWSYFIALNIVLTAIVLGMMARIGWHYRRLLKLRESEHEAALHESGPAVI
jgi:ATP:ADP antiporter, AAA family